VLEEINDLDGGRASVFVRQLWFHTFIPGEPGRNVSCRHARIVLIPIPRAERT
jgi:hypothetical protein